LVPAEGLASHQLAVMMESSALIGGILSIVQPELYEAGRDALLLLYQNPKVVT